MIRPITDPEEVEQAEEQRRAVFTGELPTPFTDALPYRCALSPIALRLEPEEFEAISNAVLETGDTTMVLSLTERSESDEPQDWEFSATKYDEYEQAARWPLEHVLISPSGTWCVFFTTLDLATAGAATPEFIETLRAGLPRESDPVALVRRAVAEGTDPDDLHQLPEMLAHLYGEDAVDGILAAARAPA